MFLGRNERADNDEGKCEVGRKIEVLMKVAPVRDDLAAAGFAHESSSDFSMHQEHSDTSPPV